MDHSEKLVERTRGPGRPRNEVPSSEHLARREQIIAHALQVFEARGYHATSLDEVAAPLGLTRQALYHYFKSKEELLIVCCDRLMADYLDKLAPAASIEHPYERLVALVDFHARAVTTNPQLFKVYHNNQHAIRPTQRNRFKAYERNYTDIFVQACQQCQRIGALSEALDPRLVADLILSMCNFVPQWLSTSDASPAAVAVTIRSMVELMLRNPAPTPTKSVVPKENL